MPLENYTVPTNNKEITSVFLTIDSYPSESKTPLPVPMDDDFEIADDLEVQKACIEEEIWKRKRANAKVRKEEEEHILIAAAEGEVSSNISEKWLTEILQVQEKQRKRQWRMPVSLSYSELWDIVIISTKYTSWC